MVRSVFAAGCPLFDRQMFIGMRLQYAFTLLGCIAFVMIPVPLLFMKYGPQLRAKSKWAPKLPPPAPPKVEVETTEKEVDKSESSENSEKQA